MPFILSPSEPIIRTALEGMETRRRADRIVRIGRVTARDTRAVGGETFVTVDVEVRSQTGQRFTIPRCAAQPNIQIDDTVQVETIRGDAFAGAVIVAAVRPAR